MVPVVLNKINPLQKKTTRIIRIVSDPYSIESGSISRRPLNTDPNYFITLWYLKIILHYLIIITFNYQKISIESKNVVKIKITLR